MKFNRCLKCMEVMEGTVCGSCGTDRSKISQDPQELKPESLLHGRYVIGCVLGQGGFGITYIGYDLNLDKKVAIKEYFPLNQVSRHSSYSVKVSWSAEAKRRGLQQYGCELFLKEARRMARIDGIPGIVRVRDTFLENETAYIIMDYVDGITMKEEVARHGTMSYDRCIELLRPIMRSLDKVHEQKLIHRDISPDNIMLRREGGACLLDLGAAKEILTDNRQSTVVVKYGFSPIEQYLAEGEIGPWTDVYALCATIYYCVTGTCIPDALARREGAKISYGSLSEKDFPSEARRLLEKGLALKAKDRIQTVGELLRQLPESEKKISGGKQGKPAEGGREKKNTESKRWKALAAAVAAAGVFFIALGVKQMTDTGTQKEEMVSQEKSQEETWAETSGETQGKTSEKLTEGENAGEASPLIETWTDENGTTYTGHQVDGTIDGFGKVEYQSGQYYIGNLEMGERTGYGFFSYATDSGESAGRYYSGHFNNKKLDGYGVYETGSYTSIRKFQEDKMGLGIEILEDGTVEFNPGSPGDYSRFQRRETEERMRYGTYDDEGNLEGEGIFYDLTSGQIYIGSFESGNLEGEGFLYCVEDGSWYHGWFENSVLTGEGFYYAQPEEWYQGEFREGLFEGEGIEHKSDGTWYEGGFVRGQRNGYGMEYTAQGTLAREGSWMEGEFGEENETWTDSNGIVFSGHKVDGKIEGYGTAEYSSQNLDSSAAGRDPFSVAYWIYTGFSHIRGTLYRGSHTGRSGQAGGDLALYLYMQVPLRYYRGTDWRYCRRGLCGN